LGGKHKPQQKVFMDPEIKLISTFLTITSMGEEVVFRTKIWDVISSSFTWPCRVIFALLAMGPVLSARVRDCE